MCSTMQRCLEEYPRRWRVYAGVFGTFVCLLATRTSSLAAVPPVIYGYTMSDSAPERELMASLQGIVARTSPEVHLGKSFWLDELVRRFPETKVEWSADPAKFLKRYRSQIAGYVMFDEKSINAATSVAGVLGAVMVDASTLYFATDAGLAQVADARGKQREWAYNKYGGYFNRDYIFVQAPRFTHQLRDFCIYKSGLMFYDDPAWENYFARQNPQSRVFGWGPDESSFFSRASKNNLMGVPADWLGNGSVLCQWKQPLEKQYTHTPVDAKAESDVHYVAFVLSDGDNVQWMVGGYLDKKFWGSPQRGAFTMNWDMTPSLAEINPLEFNYLYRTASRGKVKDYFVNAGGPGLMYPSEYPDIAAFAAANGAAMEAIDQSVISVLDNEYAADKLEAITADPRVLGTMLKVGDAYKGRKGEISWFGGKPCVSVKYTLWDRFDTPASLIRDINALPRDPTHDQKSYSIVNVHPWSEGFSGDPLTNVRQVVDGLDPKVRVVTLEEMMIYLRKHFGTPVSGEATVTK